MAIPLVGLSTYINEAKWLDWDRSAAIVTANYIDMVTLAGARPVLLPPIERGQGANEAVDMLDALVIIGGGDVQPSLYGAVPHEKTGGVDGFRDDAELELIECALEKKIPLLGICRGHQLLNVYFGGTLEQHIPDHSLGNGKFATSVVETVPGSFVHKVLGSEVSVACSHHQIIDKLGDGLVVTGRTSSAGRIHAVELVDRPEVVGVQWHPEQLGDARLLSALLGIEKPIGSRL